MTRARRSPRSRALAALGLAGLAPALAAMSLASCHEVLGDGFTIATASSIGAPCSGDDDCEGGERCIGWCTTDCSSNDDCAGPAPAGENRCIENVSGESVCFAGCRTQDDCEPLSSNSSPLVCLALELDPAPLGVCSSTGGSIPNHGLACDDPLDCDSALCVGWCTVACETSEACDGARVGACVENASGYASCFVRCGSADDCLGLGTGLACVAVSTVDGESVEICSAM